MGYFLLQIYGRGSMGGPVFAWPPHGDVTVTQTPILVKFTPIMQFFTLIPNMIFFLG